MRTKLFLIFILASQLAYSQTKSFSGTIKDKNNAPIEYANIILQQLPDTTFVGGTITNINGEFSIDAPNSNNLILQVSAIGYKTIYVQASANLQLTLHDEALEIGEVVVKGSRPISKITAQGVETTVQNTILSKMGTGNEVLKRIPMVTGNDGEYEVFGKGKAKIYINNREVRDPSEIDNLNSTDIKSIEVISNPGARYEATVAAIINIKTVKKQGDGFSFNARSSYYTWETQDYINQLNTNYRKGGLDIFANIYYVDITGFQKGDISQTTTIDTIWQQQSYMDALMYETKINGTFGANYEINDNHNVGIRYEHKTTPRKTESMDLTSQVYANSALFDNWENTEHKDYTTTPTTQTNIYYLGKINKLNIDFNGDYMNSGSQSSNVNTEISQAYGNRTLYSASSIDNNLMAAKLQLTYPIWKGELLAGSEYVNIARSDKYINNDLEGFSSDVDITENNLAFFTEYQASTKIGDFSVGVRYEDAAYDYLVDGTKDNEKSRTYGQWFPNASYSNRFGNVNLQLSYNSKVVRPTYRELSSNLLYGNRFTIETGNPYLKPTIKQDVSLMGMWKFIQAQVSYTHQKDAILMWIDRYENDAKVSVINHRNIANLPKLSAFVAAAKTFGVWSPQLSAGVQKYWQDYSSYGLNIDMKEPIYFASLNNSFNLPRDFIINLDANYTSTGYSTAIYLYNHSFKLDFDISKSLFNKALQVKLGISDITNQSDANMIIVPQAELRNLYQFDNREVYITLRYNFNAAKNKYKGKGAGKDAMNRL